MDVARSGSLLKTVLDRVLRDDAEFATCTRLIYVAELADEGAGDRIAPFLNAFVAEEWARDSNMTGLVVVQAAAAAVETAQVLVARRALADPQRDDA